MGRFQQYERIPRIDWLATFFRLIDRGISPLGRLRDIHFLTPTDWRAGWGPRPVMAPWGAAAITFTSDADQRSLLPLTRNVPLR